MNLGKNISENFFTPTEDIRRYLRKQRQDKTTLKVHLLASTIMRNLEEATLEFEFKYRYQL